MFRAGEAFGTLGAAFFVRLNGRIDSVNGGIRNTFDFVPDAPISKVVVSFEGGNKGLLVNSTDLCKGRHRATVDFTGHNGKAYDFKPVLQAKCGKGAKKKGKAGTFMA